MALRLTAAERHGSSRVGAPIHTCQSPAAVPKAVLYIGESEKESAKTTGGIDKMPNNNVGVGLNSVGRVIESRQGSRCSKMVGVQNLRRRPNPVVRPPASHSAKVRTIKRIRD